MASSYVEYTGDGVQTDWTVTFPYLDADHVHFYVAGVEVTTGLSWPSSGVIRVTPAVASGAAILVKRITPDAPLVNFQNRNNLTADNLSTAGLQAIYRAVEAADRATDSIIPNASGDFDFGGRKAVNVGTPTEDDDLATKAYADTVIGQAQTYANQAAGSASSAATHDTNSAAHDNNSATHESNAEGFANDAQSAANDAAASAASIDPANLLHADQNLTDLPDKAAARTSLGLEIGTDVPAISQAVPAGTTIYVNGNTAPSGYVKENGALLDRVDFPDLWAYAQTSGNIVTEANWSTNTAGCFSDGDGVTTFRIPDGRGEFIRGYDDGRGVDGGRSLGSWQVDAFKSHSHSYTGAAALAVGAGSSVNAAQVSGGTTSSTGGTETRPRNIAKLACIKY